MLGRSIWTSVVGAVPLSPPTSQPVSPTAGDRRVRHGGDEVPRHERTVRSRIVGVDVAAVGRSVRPAHNVEDAAEDDRGRPEDGLRQMAHDGDRVRSWCRSSGWRPPLPRRPRPVARRRRRWRDRAQRRPGSAPGPAAGQRCGRWRRWLSPAPRRRRGCRRSRRLRTQCVPPSPPWRPSAAAGAAQRQPPRPKTRLLKGRSPALWPPTSDSRRRKQHTTGEYGTGHVVRGGRQRSGLRTDATRDGQIRDARRGGVSGGQPAGYHEAAPGGAGNGNLPAGRLCELPLDQAGLDHRQPVLGGAGGRPEAMGSDRGRGVAVPTDAVRRLD